MKTNAPPVSHLSDNFLSWPRFVEGTVEPDITDIGRAYEHWSRAESVLGRASNDFDRVEIISTLKRAVDHRLRRLNEFYRLKRIPVGAPGDGQIAKLAALGVLRPSLVDHLLRIRNAIEHQDIAPPSAVECGALVEFTWYFLRSTDRLALQLANSVSYSREGEVNVGRGGLVRSDLDIATWAVELSGWVRPEHISGSSPKAYVHLGVARTETFAELRRRLGDDGDNPIFLKSHSGREPDDVFFRARVLGPPDTIARMLRSHFDAM